MAGSPALAMLVRMALIPVLILISLPAPLLTGLGIALAVGLFLRRMARRGEKSQTPVE